MFQEWFDDLSTEEKVGFSTLAAAVVVGGIGFAVGTAHGKHKERKRIESAAYKRMVDNYVDSLVRAKRKMH